MSSQLEPQTTPPQKLSRAGIVTLVLFLVAVAAIVGLLIERGIRSRAEASAVVQQDSQQLAVPAVAVIHPEPGKPANEVVLTGALQPFSEAPIYARASGYIKEWSANLGDRVKKDQVLAEIDAPEMDLQYGQAQATLLQARAAVQQAQANLLQSRANESLAKVNADRYAELAKQGIVAAADNDQRQSQYQALVAGSASLEQAVSAGQANIASQEANLASLNQIRGYRTVRAPFDGVVTARKTDVGALVAAGNNTTAPELFRIAAVDKLRLFVSVPEIYSRSVGVGLEVALTLEEFPNRRFHAKMVRSSGAFDPATRTLLSEFEVDNASGELKPGGYAEVHLALTSPGHTLLVPVSAVMFRPDGSQVGVVVDGKAKMVPVALGKDYGNVVEIVSGVSEADAVIESPPDSLTSGMAVRVVTNPAVKKQ